MRRVPGLCAVAVVGVVAILPDMKLKVLWNLDWRWLTRFYWKKLRQGLSYRFGREFYRVEIGGVEVRLGGVLMLIIATQPEG